MSYKILIVDDEPMLTELLADHLQDHGYTIFTANSSDEALAKLNTKPNLILLDINMPGMDGLELCKTIRNHIICPILFLTARITEQNKVNGLRAGGDDYITKPFSLQELAARIGSNLQLKKSFDYDIEEMQSRTDRLFFPQTFTHNNGSLFWIDRKTGNEATLFYSSESEGSNGVYSFEQGKYVATAVLAGNLTVRVYDMDSGELIATQVIENSDSTYFNRIPRIYLLDEARTAVVLLGGSITEIDTLVSTFAFGE